VRILQLIDTLESGGAERMAANIANGLAKQEGITSFLCTTRKEGTLKTTITDSVGYLFLNKRKAIDISATKRLYTFIKTHRIHIIHAHSSSFFLASIIKLLNPNIKLVWHDHYGNSEFLISRKHYILKWCARYFSHTFSVTQTLQAWGIKNLKINSNSISYLPNFPKIDNQLKETKLKGNHKKRIVCLANFRAQKDHITLLKSFKKIIADYPNWTLHCVGNHFNDTYFETIKNEIINLNLDNNVFLYHDKQDIYNILTQCDIGVLSSKSEGLPLALLEYGIAKLAVIASNVGECSNVINTLNGIITPPENSNALHAAMDFYIKNEKTRIEHAIQYHDTIIKHYSENKYITHLVSTYENLS